MPSELTPIDEDSLANLSDDELAELAEAYEQLHLREQREDIVAFALNTEVPGTPSPYSENDRIRMLKRKEQMRRARVSETEYEDAEDVEPEEPDVIEFYPKQLEIAEHQQLILESIQALMEEEPVVGPLANGHEGVAPDGVMLMVPPGGAKSTYASVVAPSWVAGRYPGTDVITLSYGADLARRFGRRVRHIARSKRYEQQFNTTITADNQAVDQWSLTNGSTYKAVGILGGVTGSRGDLVIGDDLIAGREEAESEVIRNKTWDAFKDDVLTRLKPRGKLVMIMTRWHEDDPMGRLLGEDWEGQSGLWEGTDGRWWLVLRMPLIADRDDDPLGRARGERLWPEWFDERFVELARAQGERTWNSLYQQNPSAADGNILLKSAWRCWPHGKAEPTEEQRENPHKVEPPKFGTWRQCVLYYDTALKEEEQNDYSAMTAWLSFERSVAIPQNKRTVAKQQNMLMIGAWRARIQASELLKAVLDHIDHFKPDRVVIEDKASGIQLIQELRKRRPRHEYGEVLVEAWVPPGKRGTTDKVSRAWSASLTLNEGSIWYMPGPMTEVAIKEAASFPNGRNDDLTDTITMAILHSRDLNLLEISADALSSEEIDEVEAGKMMAMQNPRPSYGFNRSKPYSQAARSLYGRT